MSERSQDSRPAAGSSTAMIGSAAAGSVAGEEATSLGVEEEFHVVDLTTRELVAQGPELLASSPRGRFRWSTRSGWL